MAEEITVTWSLPIKLTPFKDKWEADSPNLNYMGDGDTPREALADLFRCNFAKDSGSLFFYRDGQEGMTLEQVVDSLLPEEKPKFKVGDRVSVTNWEGTLHTIGTLESVDQWGSWTLRIEWCLNDGVVGRKDYRPSHDLELFTGELPKPQKPEPKFKVGDRVRSGISGLVGVITGHGNINPNMFAIRVEAHDYPWQVGQTLYRFPEDLELVPEEPPAPKPEPPFKTGDWCVCTECGHVGRLNWVEEHYPDGYMWQFMDALDQHPEVHLLKLAPEWYKRLAS